jgi:hypothetical protein
MLVNSLAWYSRIWHIFVCHSDVNNTLGPMGMAHLLLLVWLVRQFVVVVVVFVVHGHGSRVHHLYCRGSKGVLSQANQELVSYLIVAKDNESTLFAA